MDNQFRPKIDGTWLAQSNGGMRFELSATFDDKVHQLLTIVADELDESLWVEIGSGGKSVQIPMCIVQKALEDTVSEVHSESWYDRNLPSGLGA